MNKQKIAQNLRDLRGNRSREEVAMNCGITAQAISMYENGARVPSDDIKIKLAAFFKKTVQDIFFS